MHPHGRAATPGPASKQEQRPASETIDEVAPGVLRLQLPIRLTGLGHVNCYLLPDDDGVAVVDPGLPGSGAWAAFVAGLARAGYHVGDVHTVVVTHSHADHFGGALRLRYETDVEIVTHEDFAAAFDSAAAGPATCLPSFADQLAAIESHFARPAPWGGRRPAPPRMFLEQLRVDHPAAGGRYQPLVPTKPVRDGATLRLANRAWTVLHTPGHTDDHLCLHDAESGVLLTGDHVLPTITPHIGDVSSSGDALAEYFASLRRFADLNDVRIALPAHGDPFGDLRGRVAAILRHHQDRLDVLRRAAPRLERGSVQEYMRLLFREQSWGELAEDETFAHLEHLRRRGELTADTDADGLLRYGPAR
ncbi:MBL fold metallo-hydrolase [Thermocrispum sp.]|nr:MBL fold metallo-hydrolase [Thermocrispum sp.]